MMINVEPILPLLDAARQAKLDIQASDADFKALDERAQLAQVNDFLSRDAKSQKVYDDACANIMEWLEEATRATRS